MNNVDNGYPFGYKYTVTLRRLCPWFMVLMFGLPKSSSVYVSESGTGADPNAAAEEGVFPLP